MWICLNDAFLSVVKPEPRDLARFDQPDGDVLMVRARAAGHIEAVFPGVAVIESPDRDYLFRAFVARDTVAEVIADRLIELEYPNFKNSVEDDPLHDAYGRVWQVMWDYQGRQARRRNARRGGRS